MPGVVGILSEVDSVDREGLEAGDPDTQGIDPVRKFVKVVASIAAGSRCEDSFGTLIDDDNFGILDG